MKHERAINYLFKQIAILTGIRNGVLELKNPSVEQKKFIDEKIIEIDLDIADMESLIMLQSSLIRDSKIKNITQLRKKVEKRNKVNPNKIGIRRANIEGERYIAIPENIIDKGLILHF